MPGPDDILLATEDLRTHFAVRRGLLRRQVATVRAVDGIDLSIKGGETLGLVGESGCGKSTLGRTITRLEHPTGGSVGFRVDNQMLDITNLSQNHLRRRVRRHMNMIFQDPLSSLNSRMSVKSIIAEPLVLHRAARGKELEERVAELLTTVGLQPHHMQRFPHAFSGGQRQRIAIARALALQPRFIVCDEPVSALDASVRAQILNLLMSLQQQFGLTYLFISHDLAVVRHVSDRIAVMYLGQIVERGPTVAICQNPQHPYTEALLSAIPMPVARHGRRSKRIVLTGDVPNPANPPSGCRFAPRCPYRQQICDEEIPELRPTRQGHTAACHFADELDLVGIGKTGAQPTTA
ncbi:MAG: ATP-binding cassette domain-containing protein [Caldilineaceae bacterium]|nr:ATP-binding cassette domain-containing protein [Caldilineaceae bacterium]